MAQTDRPKNFRPKNDRKWPKLSVEMVNIMVSLKSGYLGIF